MKDSNSQALAMFHAYLDDQLSPAARAQFEQLSEKNSALQKQLSQQLNIRQQIRARYLELPLDNKALNRLQNFIGVYGEAPATVAASNSVTHPAQKVKEPQASFADDAAPAPSFTQEIVLEDRDADSWQLKIERFANERFDVLSNTLQSLKNSPQHIMPKQLIPQHWIKPAAIALSFALVFAVGLLFGRSGDSESSPNNSSLLPAIELMALDAHRIYAAEQVDALEIPASDNDKLNDWLSKRVQTPVTPAKLDSQGYQLMGARLLPSLRKNAAMYMYHDAQDHRVSLILRRNPSNEASMECRQSAELNLCRWQDKNLLYFVISDLSLRQIKPIARAVQNTATPS